MYDASSEARNSTAAAISSGVPKRFIGSVGVMPSTAPLIWSGESPVQKVLPFMKAGGSIVLNTSVVTEYGTAGFSVYPAAKSAVKSFIKSFAAEFTERGIRVNGVSPGYIATNIFNNTVHTGVL